MSFCQQSLKTRDLHTDTRTHESHQQVTEKFITECNVFGNHMEKRKDKFIIQFRLSSGEEKQNPQKTHPRTNLEKKSKKAEKACLAFGESLWTACAEQTASHTQTPKPSGYRKPPSY